VVGVLFNLLSLCCRCFFAVLGDTTGGGVLGDLGCAFLGGDRDADLDLEREADLRAAFFAGPAFLAFPARIFN
jgi:hypothetical protein